MTWNLLSKNKARDLHSLSQKKIRDKEGLFLAEGHKCVSDMIGSYELQFLIATKNWLETNDGLAEEFKNKVLMADDSMLKLVSSLSSVPDVIAVFKIPENTEELPSLDEDSLYLLLDNIQDPGNLGTIIRTADWFGVYNIFASNDTVDVYNPKVVQATMGSLSRVKMNYLDLRLLIDRNVGMPVIGTLLDGESLSEVKINKGALIILGNEGKGISLSLQKKITHKVTIPPSNPIAHPDSLNVAIANAIVLSHFRNSSKFRNGQN